MKKIDCVAGGGEEPNSTQSGCFSRSLECCFCCSFLPLFHVSRPADIYSFWGIGFLRFLVILGHVFFALSLFIAFLENHFQEEKMKLQ